MTILRVRHPGTDPVAALAAWIAAAGLTEGPFSNRVVALIVKRTAKRVGTNLERLSSDKMFVSYGDRAVQNFTEIMSRIYRMSADCVAIY